MQLLAGIITGAIGTAYLVYAKRQYNAPFAIAGGLLILYPYLVSGALLTIVIGIALALAPFVYERYAG